MKNKNDRRRALWDSRQEEGLCVYCGLDAPKVGCKGCHVCQKKKSDAARRYIEKNPETNRNYRQLVRSEVINKYGGKCRCCGEAVYEFLAIDHINNDGHKERKEFFGSQKGSSYRFYLKLRKEKLRDDLQVLCHNCNMAKAMYGRCPHEYQAENQVAPGLLQSSGS